MDHFVRLLLCWCAILSVVPTSATATTIDTVPVGNVGNVHDPSTGNLYGGVNYDYRMGTTEVTVGQYTAFLNAVAATDTYALYNPNMATSLYALPGIERNGLDGSHTYSVIGSPNKPVTFVSWGDAARFSNWLHNGQPTGGQDASATEDGAYTLNGALTSEELYAAPRNAGAKWFIPAESEWYKAAYHKNDGPTDNYWDYPTSTDTAPYSDQPPGSDAPSPSNTANMFANDWLDNGYDDGYAVSGGFDLVVGLNLLTDAGAYAATTSSYGTFDQGGNVWEWTEFAFHSNGVRQVRGGSFDHGADVMLSSVRNYAQASSDESWIIGFRVATVPEPSSAALAALGCALLAWRRWKHRLICSVLLSSLLCILAAQFAAAVSIDTVPIGDAGNAPNENYNDLGQYGAVDHAYRIGRYEVTNSQYVEFLNAKAKSDPFSLYNTNMGTEIHGGISQSGPSGNFNYEVRTNMGNKPVNYVSFYDAIRFANWLNNGQGSGDTETGAYTLADGTGVIRNAGATWFLPTGDEWYKAAYYDPRPESAGGPTGGPLRLLEEHGSGQVRPGGLARGDVRRGRPGHHDGR
jgi:formylglycine-generating enzyme